MEPSDQRKYLKRMLRHEGFDSHARLDVKRGSVYIIFSQPLDV